MALQEPQWERKLHPDNLVGALSYLRLKYDDAEAQALVRQLKRAKVVEERCNDILRACRLEPLKLKDPGVQAEKAKVDAGKPFHPILLVSYPTWSDIADGYHRTSYLYAVNPFAMIPLVIAHYDETDY